jgi:hypothetical protein
MNGFLKDIFNRQNNLSGGVDTLSQSPTTADDTLSPLPATTEESTGLASSKSENLPDFSSIPKDTGQWKEDLKNGKQLSPRDSNGNVLPGSYSKSAPMEPTHETLYTIPAGTILYHGTTIMETFDPARIILGNEELVAFFSQDIRLASDYVNGCVDGDKGAIHKFKTLKDIDRIYIVSQYDKSRGKNWDLKNIEDNFCKNSKRYNGVGFFILKQGQYKSLGLTGGDPLEQDNKQDGQPDGQQDGQQDGQPDDQSIQKTDIINVNDITRSDSENPESSDFSAEFAICNPDNYILEYIETQKCIGKRILSGPYSFGK